MGWESHGRGATPTLPLEGAGSPCPFLVYAFCSVHEVRSIFWEGTR